jgi:hypothetical protein
MLGSLPLLVLLAACLAPTAWAAPLAQEEACPLASDELVSGALGASTQLFSDFGVTISGPSTECLFEGDAGLVIVGRRAGFFGTAGVEAFTPDQLERLRRTSELVDYAPVAGVGDVAAWATIQDPALAAERQPVLIVKRGPDAFVFSVDDSMLPDALGSARALALAVLANVNP